MSAPLAAVSACAKHRAWIETQVQLGRNAMSIYQDLVEDHGFTHRYNSVKRFVAKLRAREPERFDVLEFLPGEEAQVDFGLGAPTRHTGGRSKRPFLFVLTLKYSGKSFRKTVWKADQESWARLHEDAFHALGGCVRYVVLDNLKAGVLRPDLYEPELNPLYAALLRHYGAVADPCRVRDPNRKGSVENAIQHTQSTALKGRRFESIEAQNAWLAHWEERWAAPRLHGRKKRQVLAMFQEEQPHLLPLPAERFRYFTQGTRTVDDAGLVQVDGSYYAALPAPPHSAVMVRIYDREIEILDAAGQHVRRHEKSLRKGSFTLELATLKFLDAKEDVLVIGPPGTGKSHIAKALATTAVRRGYKVLYREAHQLIEDITEARELGDLRKLRAQIRGAELLLIDDLFLRKLPAQAGDELADVLMGRYEKASTILTSNRPLDDWTRLLGDVVVVTPLLDRLMHHGHLLKFEGKSWRLKEAAARAAKRG